MKQGIIFGDVHRKSTESPHPSYLLVKKFAQSFKPTFVVDLGDSLHLDYFSDFEEGNILEGDWENDVSLLNVELDFWQELVGEEFHWCEGNHDYRAVRAAKKIQNIALKQSLDYVRRFNIKERKIKFYPITEGAGKIGKLHFTHGWYWNKYHAWTHLDRFSGNLIYGHVHANQQAHKFLAAREEEVQTWSIGCLCDKSPEYVKGRPTGWQHSFAIVYVHDNGNFNLYRVNIIKNQFIWAGELWNL